IVQLLNFSHGKQSKIVKLHAECPPRRGFPAMAGGGHSKTAGAQWCAPAVWLPVLPAAQTGGPRPGRQGTAVVPCLRWHPPGAGLRLLAPALPFTEPPRENNRADDPFQHHCAP